MSREQHLCRCGVSNKHMKRYALCIGNDKYTVLTQLRYAVADAESVYRKLSNLGFDADVFYNLSRDSLAEKLSSFSDKLEEYDAVLLYYAGHGFQIAGDNLLVPVDFDKPADEKLAKWYAFPLENLMYWLKKYPKKTKVVILDACRELYGSRGLGNNFAPVIAPQGSIIAFSTSSGQTSKEKGGHGLYTKFLLEHMDEPRISIETMFKRVRTDLAEETHGAQIAWEHTSLIGEFQLNPNTIYDGTNYSSDAVEDSQYVFERDSKAKIIVEGMKSYTWSTQKDALKKITDLDFSLLSADDLFVLGRNIYQAACGSCFDCQYFIDHFTRYHYIPIEAKSHLLNGMVFEIYYDSQGNLRRNFKAGYYDNVVKIVESETYYSSCEFISTRLLNEDNKPFYIPGQNDKIRVKVVTTLIDDVIAVDDIIFKGKSIFFNPYDGEKPVVEDYGYEKTRVAFEADLRKKMVVMPGYLKVDYEGENVDPRTKLRLPLCGYNVFPTLGE